MTVAVTVAARVISIFRPLQASATSSGLMPNGVLRFRTFPCWITQNPESWSRK